MTVPFTFNKPSVQDYMNFINREMREKGDLKRSCEEEIDLRYELINDKIAQIKDIEKTLQKCCDEERNKHFFEIIVLSQKIINEWGRIRLLQATIHQTGTCIADLGNLWLQVLKVQ